MSDIAYDDPAGRTRFAWARTLLVTFVVSLLVERLYFSGSHLSIVALALPLVTIAVVTLLRSRPLRGEATGIAERVPFIVVGAVLFIALAALLGVLLR